MTRWSIPTIVIAMGAITACEGGQRPATLSIAEDIFATPGEIRPDATEAQRLAFERGESVALKRFGPDEGLGPLFNVTFCASCHEKPTAGGAAGHYRDFYIYGQTTADGAFLDGGVRSGVLAAYGLDPAPLRPFPENEANTFAPRNPVPFFGIGYLAELPESSILAHADPDDADNDGISGRPNYDRGFVGRFGLKAQTVNIEGFIRGPIFNHMGITSDPLTEARRAELPIPSARDVVTESIEIVSGGLTRRHFHQAAAPSEPLTDEDLVEDPELRSDALFDLVSWAMLLAAPAPGQKTPASLAGEALFESLGCAQCHVPVLDGPRGGIPVYSDLLLHDMGPDLADGITMGLASGSEFRTAPLWGIGAVGPYLHDGRAATLDEAIRYHGGEGLAASKAYLDLSQNERGDVVAFLLSLGQDSVRSEGLIPPGAPIGDVGGLGGPRFELDDRQRETWLRGRSLFDRDFSYSDGLGPLFNGDSCRGCHFDPVPGGSGPSGVDVMRHGNLARDGRFVTPMDGNILAKFGALIPRPESPGSAVFERRQSLSVLGVGILGDIEGAMIEAQADPDDEDGDGISGRVHYLDGLLDQDADSTRQIGRFGWKAQIPSIAEFVRDALSVELGMSLAPQPGLHYGITTDGDGVADPEISRADLEAITFYINTLAPPRPERSEPGGAEIFESLGCTLCHVAKLDPTMKVPAYTDLLLHDVTNREAMRIAEENAHPEEYRTPPLWGLRFSAPYLHDGTAASVADAILAHGSEAQQSRDSFQALNSDDKAQLLRFLETR